MANKNFDECASFLIDNGLFVGRICRLENVLKTIIAKHGYVKNVSAALSESTALAVLLANALKFDGLFTLQLQGNGPVSTIVVDVTSGGTMRACANYDKDRLQKAFTLRKNEGEIEATPHLLGQGTLAFTIDDGKGNYHQGVVELQGKTLEECALRYFKQSEQIETMLRLFVEVPETENGIWKAGGILLQQLRQIRFRLIFPQSHLLHRHRHVIPHGGKPSASAIFKDNSLNTGIQTDPARILRRKCQPVIDSRIHIFDIPLPDPDALPLFHIKNIDLQLSVSGQVQALSMDMDNSGCIRLLHFHEAHVPDPPAVLIFIQIANKLFQTSTSILCLVITIYSPIRRKMPVLTSSGSFCPPCFSAVRSASRKRAD